MFKRAVPVFETGRENDMNTFYGFYTRVPKSDGSLLRIAGASTYCIYINGEFVFTGPARAAHGFYRVDTSSARERRMGRNHPATGKCAQLELR